MNKPFSEMVYDEKHNVSRRFNILTDMLNELDELLTENAYLRAENKHLRELNERYEKNLQESIDNSMFNIGEALKACLHKDE